MRKWLLFKIVFVFAFSGQAQNNFGSLHSNYTPTNSLYINPSSILDAKVWLDINIVGAGSYTNNNLVYLEDQRWFDVSRDAIRGEVNLTDDDVGFDQGRNKYHAYNRNFVQGLSGVWSQGDHAAGISAGFRSFTDLRGVPDYMAQFIENGVADFTAQHDIDYQLEKVRVASSQFGEIKGTYAYTFFKRRRDMFMGGVSLSKFFPVGGAAANIYNADFNVDNDTLILLDRFTADAMYTPEPQFNGGKGWGLDLGFTFQRMLGEAGSYFPNSTKLGCRENPYKFKLGVSLMDLGSIKFPEDQVRYAGYDFTNFDWYRYQATEVDEEDAVSIFAAQEGDITSGNVRKPYRMSLPTFASVQFDYNLWASRIYVNTTIIQGIPPGKNSFGVRHANSLSVTPRYESFWFDLAIPFSLYEYRYPQMGLSARLGPLTLGTDKLWSWIAKSDIYGADIYLHLKIPIHYNPKCKGYRKANKSKNGQRYKKYRPCEAYG